MRTREQLEQFPVTVPGGGQVLCQAGLRRGARSEM